MLIELLLTGVMTSEVWERTLGDLTLIWTPCCKWNQLDKGAERWAARNEFISGWRTNLCPCQWGWGERSSQAQWDTLVLTSTVYRVMPMGVLACTLQTWKSSKGFWEVAMSAWIQDFGSFKSWQWWFKSHTAKWIQSNVHKKGKKEQELSLH